MIVRRMATARRPLLGGWLALLGLAVPAGASTLPAKALAPIPSATMALMGARDTSPGAPILVRSFKKEAELEIWKLSRSGRYVLLKTFPICRWSGQLGPKQRQGDRQTPEGFYSVAPKQMNPNSAYHLSFDLGFPNAYDRAHGASGSYLMVHGICSSAGCYAMTDVQIGEIYALAREAFAGGQRAFQFQAFPFRMTARNMARVRTDPHADFWRQLKEGSDRFEATGEEPVVAVEGGRYVFRPARDPGREALAQARLAGERTEVDRLVADGIGSVRISYADGGQNPHFAALLRRGVSLGDVSRPEALAFAGREIVIVPNRPKPSSQLASAQPLPPPRAGQEGLVAMAPRQEGLAALFAARRAIPDGRDSGPVLDTLPGSSRILPASLLPAPTGRLAQR